SLGILTNWSHQHSSLGAIDYATLRFHFCTVPGLRDTSLTITVDDPKAEQDEGPSSSLELQSLMKVTDTSDARETMQLAHDALGDKFLELLNDDLRRRWGLRNE